MRRQIHEMVEDKDSLVCVLIGKCARGGPYRKLPAHTRIHYHADEVESLTAARKGLRVHIDILWS